MHILVTGAGGFIGRALCPALARRGHRVVAGLRRGAATEVPPPSGIEQRILGGIVPGRDWSRELAGIDAIVHLAQRAHARARLEVLAAEPEAAAALARGAARAGVRCFVYLSSIKAMGDATLPGRPFRPDDPPRPEDAYGRAKLMTESALAMTAAATGLEIAIVRPPLVYGPGVRGNFRALVRLAASGLPLPFAAIDNRRSLIFVDNLADLIATAIVHPAASGRVLLASDGADFSTAELVRILAAGQGREARLVAMPEKILAGLRRMPFLGPAVSRLTASLQVDDGATRDLLGWRPPVAAGDALHTTVRALASREARELAERPPV